MKSIWNNNIFFRILLLTIWLVFIVVFNYMFFSWVIWISLWLNIFIILLLLWFLLFYMIKYFKYTYKISEQELVINTPRKIYRIPFKDIQKISRDYKIPFVYKFGVNFNHNENILYFCWFADKWILIKLETHSIVISPLKYEQFFNKLIEI